MPLLVSSWAALVMLLFSLPSIRGFVISTAGWSKIRPEDSKLRVNNVQFSVNLSSDGGNAPTEDFPSEDGDDFEVVEAQAESNVRYVDAIPTLSSVTNPEAVRLREELLDLADATQRGFSSSQAQKERAREIIYKLANYNPSTDPAMPYYDDNNSKNSASDASSSYSSVSLAGKWDLVYTDAPDITSLDTSRNPLATAELGRIGQECNPPYIKNVIEWKKPDWSNQLPLPFVGNSDSRVLQKVCVKAKATPEKPFLVDLELVGIDLVAPPKMYSNTKLDDLGLMEAIESEGLPAGILRKSPVELRGPLTAPFGQFEILYLDEEMRIVRTGQNYLAVNLRAREEWF